MYLLDSLGSLAAKLRQTQHVWNRPATTTTTTTTTTTATLYVGPHPPRPAYGALHSGATGMCERQTDRQTVRATERQADR